MINHVPQRPVKIQQNVQHKLSLSTTQLLTAIFPACANPSPQVSYLQPFFQLAPTVGGVGCVWARLLKMLLRGVFFVGNATVRLFMQARTSARHRTLLLALLFSKLPLSLVIRTLRKNQEATNEHPNCSKDFYSDR